jgi:hypothetical protein
LALAQSKADAGRQHATSTAIARMLTLFKVWRPFLQSQQGLLLCARVKSKSKPTT